MSLFPGKIKGRLWSEIVLHARSVWLYPFLYKSYWHSLLTSNKDIKSGLEPYFTATPNPGAGIGHQLANWIAGYWWAKQFGCRFAHASFSSPQWEYFFGFGEDEVSVNMLKLQGFKMISIPLFGQDNQIEIARTKRIIQSYSGKKVILVCEQDQGYMEQFGVMEDIQRKFYAAQSRKDNKLIYSEEYFNIAIHVRRGDIVVGNSNGNDNLKMRWQGNDYFTKVLTNVLKMVDTDKPLAIYLFSQGVESDFSDFLNFSNLTFCLDMGAQDSFLHMVMADLLITSKSSFSYKPALLNRGIKVCPNDFWHGYPKSEDWILADETGNFIGKNSEVIT
jgi:hypothetical protein